MGHIAFKCLITVAAILMIVIISFLTSKEHSKNEKNGQKESLKE
ncbi:hypothetical protein SDC9_111570 [bioreactor metagenome]|uniref:Uncharacterized protein n=1 Tax=bioreactor metagenome TaxID=1076179 RepID=A0A645BHE1_9ZZZZ